MGGVLECGRAISRPRETIVRFAVAQSERHGRYMQLLNSTLAAYRNDAAMLAALEKFARKSSRRSTSAETPQNSAAPQPELPQPLPRTITA